MKDRQFMTLLGLVVAAGLVMGLVASRMTSGSAPVPIATAGSSAVGNATAPRSSAGDGDAYATVDSQPAAPSSTTGAGSQNGEPLPITEDMPEMQGPATAAPPAAAAAPSPPPAPSADTPSVAAAPSGDSPPQ